MPGSENSSAPGWVAIEAAHRAISGKRSSAAGGAFLGFGARDGGRRVLRRWYTAPARRR